MKRNHCYYKIIGCFLFVFFLFTVTGRRISLALDNGSSAASTADGSTWVVWSAANDTGSSLYYCIFDDSSWSYPQNMPTHLSSNTAASVIVDNSDIPWIVWAGFDGQDDDIYYTRWNGLDWNAPLRVNKDDCLPDILPSIRMDEEGNLRVVWLGYNGEKYKKYSSKWTETKWSDEAESDEDLDTYSDMDVYNEATDYYCTFGDSITAGTVNSGIAYQTELETLLDANVGPSEVLNYGKGGENTAAGLNRLDGILSNNVFQYCLILEGTNDSLFGISYHTTVYNLGLMADKCRESGVIPILSNLTPDTSTGGSEKRIPTTYNPAIWELSEEKGFRLSDQYGAAIDDWESLTDDGKHPNNAGYQIMAQTWYDTILALEPDRPPPIVDTASASAIGETTATLNGQVNPNGLQTYYFFEYGMTTGYGKTTQSMDAGSDFTDLTVSADVNELFAETTYHFRLVATNNSGTSYGDDRYFTTSEATVTTLPATSADETSVTLNGQVNPNGLQTYYFFEYGTTTGYGKTTQSMDAGSDFTDLTVSADVTGLSAGSTYHFRLVAVKSSGIIYGRSLSFSTLESSGGGCFIATAAFGSPLAPHVTTLKKFRDRYLLNNHIGRKFVAFYYRYSPLAAGFIAKYEPIKLITRACLYPVVGFSHAMLRSSVAEKILIYCLCFLPLAGAGIIKKALLKT